jgi:creatinine amidohydrolase
MKFRYQEMTWHEVKAAAAADRVVLQPVGMIEDHGPHLPVVTDILVANEICARTAACIPADTILMPPQWHGYSPHHMDFPGPITINGKTLIDYMLGITESLVHHGFRRILVVNGHGSNGLWMEAVARLTIVRHPETLCAAVNWWNIPEVTQAIGALKTSGAGGTSHAGELETSMVLAIRPDLVDMSKAVKEISYPRSRYFPHHSLYQSDRKVKMTVFWSTETSSGVMGDPTEATQAKGEAWLEAAVEGLSGIVSDLKRREIEPRVDHH